MKGLRALPKEKLQRIVLVGTMALIGMVMAWFLYGHKQWVALNVNRASIAKLKGDVAKAKESAQAMAQTVPLRGKMQAFVEAQRATMVSGDPFAWVVREIALLAGSQPVRDITMRPGGVLRHPRKDRYELYVTRIEFVGRYDQIGAFVQELENKFPEAEVRSLDIAGSDSAEAGHRAAIDLAFAVRPELPSEKAATVPGTGPKAKP
jgi:Tfp pilus assembly protein PilO